MTFELESTSHHQGSDVREALVAEIKKLAEDMADAACATEAGAFVERQRKPLHAAIDRLAAAPDARQAEDAARLLDEVRSHFTRDDDLPDDLLPRIDAFIDAARATPSVGGKESAAQGSKRYEVDIEIMYDGDITALALVAKNGGYRITSRKGSGSWRTRGVLRCNFTSADLDKYNRLPEGPKP